MDLLGKLFGGIGKGVGYLGNALGTGANWIGQGVGTASNALGGMFNSFKSGANNPGNLSTSLLQIGPSYNPTTGQPIGNPSPSGGNPGGGGGGFSGLWNGLNSFTKDHPLASGMASIFGSSMIPNPAPPKLPQSFMDYQNIANMGGPQISQAGAGAVNGILNTPFSQVSQEEEDAATHVLDLNYQEQLRQLNGMYKSLRPGTDPTSDTTYQRDLGLLNDQYSRAKAQTVAQLHRQAYQDYAGRQLQGAGVAGQLGQMNMGDRAAAVQAEVSRANAEWQNEVARRNALRNQLLQIGGLQTFKGLFPGMNPAGNWGMNMGTTSKV